VADPYLDTTERIALGMTLDGLAQAIVVYMDGSRDRAHALLRDALDAAEARGLERAAAFLLADLDARTIADAEVLRDAAERLRALAGAPAAPPCAGCGGTGMRGFGTPGSGPCPTCRPTARGLFDGEGVMF
jgi:hypothetical protein